MTVTNATSFAASLHATADLECLSETSMGGDAVAAGVGTGVKGGAVGVPVNVQSANMPHRQMTVSTLSLIDLLWV